MPGPVRAPVDGDPAATRWVLVLSLAPVTPGAWTGVVYFVGHFDGIRFTPDDPTAEAVRLDFGADYYAAVSFADTPDSERVSIGWMGNWTYAADVPSSTFRGSMSVPRVHRLATGRPHPHPPGARACGRRTPRNVLRRPRRRCPRACRCCRQRRAARRSRSALSSGSIGSAVRAARPSRRAASGPSSVTTRLRPALRRPHQVGPGGLPSGLPHRPLRPPACETSQIASPCWSTALAGGVRRQGRVRGHRPDLPQPLEHRARRVRRRRHGHLAELSVTRLGEATNLERAPVTRVAADG